jgi:NADP-dependent 3-hydroxy acid dehydrogenase YdfG
MQEAAARLVDVDLMVNNAGVALGSRLIAVADLSAARQEAATQIAALLLRNPKAVERQFA